ncbi:MAG: hypothetical protein ACI9EZ_000503 [Halobacteriales archaeon]|jgi:hypothetical protein
MPVEIDSRTDELDDVATKIKEEYDGEFKDGVDVRAVAVQVTGPGFVAGGGDREGWIFTDLIGAIETHKQRLIDDHF